MTYKEESYVLDTLKELRERIRDMPDVDIKTMAIETHENNIMLKEIIKVINTYLSNYNNENDNDFFRNVLANLISNGININRIIK